MVAWLAGHVDWFWNLMKQPKWVANLLGWSWAKITSFIPKAPK